MPSAGVGIVTLTDHNPVARFAVVLAKNISGNGRPVTGSNTSRSMNASMNTPGSAVPLIIVGKTLVGDGMVLMVTDGGVESNVNDVELDPVLNAESVASAKTV